MVQEGQCPQIALGEEVANLLDSVVIEGITLVSAKRGHIIALRIPIWHWLAFDLLQFTEVKLLEVFSLTTIRIVVNPLTPGRLACPTACIGRLHGDVAE